MNVLPFLSIKAKNLKCFGEKSQGFDIIKPINVIIGRNNTGKTTLLDVLAFAHRPSTDPDLRNCGSDASSPLTSKEPQVVITADVSGELASELENNMKKHFPQDKSNLSGLYQFFKGKRVPIDIRAGSQPALGREFDQVTFDQVTIGPLLAPTISDVSHHVIIFIYKLFSSMEIVRIAADRDIRAEEEYPFSSINESDLNSAGDGATRIMAHMLTNDNLAHKRIIEYYIKKGLNDIYEPDGKYNRIIPWRREGKDGKWEIFLESERGIAVPLSRMGSGVKTILLTLLAIHVLPSLVFKQSLDKFIFPSKN